LWTAIFPLSGSSLSPTCCQPFCLSSLCLLKVPTEISSRSFLPSLVHLQHPTPCCVFLFNSCLLFSFFLWGGGVSLSRGLLGWFIPGMAVGIQCDPYLLTCWSARCLQSRFGAGVCQCRSPPVFSV
jgi:hypothetical protein